MMTWNSLNFMNPSSHSSEIIIQMNDYLTMLLVSILMSVMFKMCSSIFSKEFYSMFYINHQLESIWTIVPFLILVFIMISSLKSLYLLDTCFYCNIMIQIIGHQWYWSYFYKELEEFFFDSYMMSQTDFYFIRLLDVDNRLIIPTNLPIRVMITSADVIHSWSMPSMGMKVDAIPGRINQLCFCSKRSGIFFGQCSEICGSNHSFMPIVMESMPMKNFYM